MDYQAFVDAKGRSTPPVGFNADAIGDHLFPFQADIVRWALRRGRAAIFCDTGLGKTVQQLEWARRVAAHASGRVLILAPLAVAHQTVREAKRFGIDAEYRREMGGESPIVVANYEMLHAFDPSAFIGIVLDESSILKSFDGRTRTAIIEAFRETPYRLACTATPAPNDFMELGNHAEFLGVMTRAEMLSMYFVHDGGATQDWRIKGHAEIDFWRWVCEWAVMVRKPSDLGYPDGDFALPPLTIEEHVVGVDHMTAHASGMLFKMEAVTLDEQRGARRGTLQARVAKCAELVNDDSDQWLIWCGLNDEGDAVTAAIPGAVQVTGSDDPDDKIARVLDFIEGRTRVLVSKASIFGYGLNLQNAHKMAFVGIGHSYEQFYQSVRREWRFGQKHAVIAHVIIAETEGRVVANLKRKEADATRMAVAMVGHMRDIQEANIKGTGRVFTAYRADRSIHLPQWLIAAAQEA